MLGCAVCHPPLWPFPPPCCARPPTTTARQLLLAQALREMRTHGEIDGEES